MFMEYLSSQNNFKSTNKRYMIAIRVGSNTKKAHCRGSMPLNLSRTAAALAVAIARKEDKVNLVYFTDNAVQMNLSPDIKIQDVKDEIASQALIADTLYQEVS